MDRLRMTSKQEARWCSIMLDVRIAANRRTNEGRSVGMISLFALSALLKRSEGATYTVVRLGRIFRGALQVHADGTGKDITAAIRLIERAEEDGRITASQRAELMTILGTK